MSDPRKTLEWLDKLSREEAANEFLKCCGSRNWARAMADDRPFESIDSLKTRAAELWWGLGPDDWLEAFRSHPKIGEKKPTITVPAQAQTWSGQEQVGIETSCERVLNELAQLNREYEAKFGYIFIVCATGKSAAEMLELLKSRIGSGPDKELRIAAAEQEKITEIRIGKLLG